MGCLVSWGRGLGVTVGKVAVWIRKVWSKFGGWSGGRWEWWGCLDVRLVVFGGFGGWRWI